MTNFHAYKYNRLEVLVWKEKKKGFFIFCIIVRKLYIQWQYDLQMAQLEHKAQMHAKFYECVIVFAQWSGNESMMPAQPHAGQTTFFPIKSNT